MARLHGFRVRNYGPLRDVTLGRLSRARGAAPLTPLTAVIGKNGAGKSTLFDAFGFVADALRNGVEDACEARGRGGFGQLRTQGESGPIEFEIYYKKGATSRPITYELSIAADRRGRPFVLEERLRQRRKGQKYGRPFTFLRLEKGLGVAWKGAESGFREDPEVSHVGESHLGMKKVNRPSPRTRSRSTWRIAAGLGSPPWEFSANIPVLQIPTLHRRVVSQLLLA